MHAEALLDVNGGHKGVRKVVKNGQTVVSQKVAKNVILIRGIGDPSVVNDAFVDVPCPFCALPMPRGVVKATVMVIGGIIRNGHMYTVSM